MTDHRHRQPTVDQAPHTIPQYVAVLAAARQRTLPEPPYLESKEPQRRSVHGHPVISVVTPHHRLQPLAQFGNGFVHAPLKLGFHLIQLRLQPFPYRLPQHRKPSIAPLLYANMRAGLRRTSRYRCTGWGLPLSPTASASRSESLTRLNTRPARFLVNASMPPSRAAPHDSGPMWVATSHSYDSFIHYTSPVYPAHRRKRKCISSPDHMM